MSDSGSCCEKSASRKTDKSRSRRAADLVLWFLKDQWFLVGVGVVTAIASQVQVPTEHQAVKQVVVSYLASQYQSLHITPTTNPAIVSIVFFVTGCNLDTGILLNNYRKWRQHLFVQIGCFLMVSALAFAVVSLAATSKSFMDAWFLIGLIFNGVQPTAMATNVLFTKQSHGNAVLTVVETTIGNFIGPFLTPILLKMYLSAGAWYTQVVPLQNGGYGALYRRVFKQFGLSIYIPLFIGQLCRYCFPNTVQKVFVDWKLSKLGSLSMLTILWQTFDHAFSTGAIQQAKASNLVFIVFISILNYLLWLVITLLLSVLWFDRKDTVAIAMCIPAKTLALGLPLSFLVFTNIEPIDEAKIQVPLIIFQIMQIGMASLCTIGFRRWVDAGERTDQAVEASTKADETHEKDPKQADTDALSV